MDNVSICKVCGNKFSGKRKDALYCSNKCGAYKRNVTYIKLHPEKLLEKRKNERNNFERYTLSRIKSKCKKYNIDFNLTIDDITKPNFCPVLGLELKYNYGNGSGFHSDSPSLDRINPALGYIKGNVRIISARANLLKSNATVEEMIKILKDLKEITDGFI